MSFKFDPGEVLSTKRAMDIILNAKTAGKPYIERHLKGDFGEVGYDISKQNKESIKNKSGYVLSRYILNNGSEICIVTDFENNATAFCETDEDCTYLLTFKKFEEE
jgi:hypothetical protein